MLFLHYFLRKAWFKWPVRRTTANIRRFYMTKNDFTILEGLSIRYFFPRTSDSLEVTPRKESIFSPDGYKVIYEFPHQSLIQKLSSVLAFTAAFTFYNIYKLCTKPAEDHETEKPDPVSEELQYEYSPSEVIKKKDNSIAVYLGGDPRLKLFFAVIIITLFLYVRSITILEIHHKGNSFLTVFYRFLSFKKKIIGHEAKDCCYYPNRKLLKYKCLGKNVIFFRELLTDKNIELYVRGKVE